MTAKSFFFKIREVQSVKVESLEAVVSELLHQVAEVDTPTRSIKMERTNKPVLNEPNKSEQIYDRSIKLVLKIVKVENKPVVHELEVLVDSELKLG